MKYQKKKKWKYKVYEDCEFTLNRHFPKVEHPFFTINKNKMIVKKGYTWDGPSGPVIDTKKLILVSLPHDVFYQSIRENLLDECWKNDADKEFEEMYKDRTSWGLRWFGDVLYGGVKY